MFSKLLDISKSIYRYNLRFVEYTGSTICVMHNIIFAHCRILYLSFELIVRDETFKEAKITFARI